jgi:4-nitrophenyl phosphatase
MLARASAAVRGGARLIGANSDATYPTPHGEVPGGGAILAAIERASGRRAVVAGKPHQPMANLVREMLPDADLSRAIMVGDRMDTDGEFAGLLGCTFAQVRTGVAQGPEGEDGSFVDLADVVRAILG